MVHGDVVGLSSRCYTCGTKSTQFHVPTQSASSIAKHCICARVTVTVRTHLYSQLKESTGNDKLQSKVAKCFTLIVSHTSYCGKGTSKWGHDPSKLHLVDRRDAFAFTQRWHGLLAGGSPIAVIIIHLLTSTIPHTWHARLVGG